MGKNRKKHRLNGHLSQQRGVGFISFIAIIAVASLVGVLVFKAGPMYANHMTVMEIVNDVVQEPALADKSLRAVRKSIADRFRMNSLWDLDSGEVLKVRRERGSGLIIDVDYEVRASFIYNMELVAHFTEQDVGTP